MARLSFTYLEVPVAERGGESCVPDVAKTANVQNRLDFRLNEYEEIYEGYGQLTTIYPYRRYTSFDRALQKREVLAAVLESGQLRAEFLPEYGGRLWRLYDKEHERELLYTNDCLRASNLAVRGAWFAGGVEFNCGVIGHSPFTMDDIFASRLEWNGEPVLRMYAFERIRGVVYQMDFWLDEEAPALNCHMSISNQNRDLIPMYWWSNIAVPRHFGGRLYVPAEEAYAIRDGAVTTVPVPVSDGVDVSDYGSIPFQCDHFFKLAEDTPKWIASTDREGWGLLHTSTERLGSRKLFVWGRSPGADRWQGFLTDRAGPYIEIQGGLGKTQYGCIPMAANTTWEWTERYEPLRLPAAPRGPFGEVCAHISGELFPEERLRQAELMGHRILKETSQPIHKGGGDGALENMVRQARGLPPLRPHLSFESDDIRQNRWKSFLETGELEPPKGFPEYDVQGEFWHDRLCRAARKDRGNWYIFYCLALVENSLGRFDLAKRAAARSLRLEPNSCTAYLSAVFAAREGRPTMALRHISAALDMGGGELSLVKGCMDLCAGLSAWNAILELLSGVPETIRRDGRIQFHRARSLHMLGRHREALDILEADGGLVPDDLRECEVTVGALWQDIQKALTGESPPVPYTFDFHSMDPEGHI